MNLSSYDGEKDDKIRRQQAKRCALIWNVVTCFLVCSFVYVLLNMDVSKPGAQAPQDVNVDVDVSNNSRMKKKVFSNQGKMKKKILHSLRHFNKNTIGANTHFTDGVENEGGVSWKKMLLPPTSLYRVSHVRENDGNSVVSMQRYSGMITLIVNVACKWGKTERTYTELIELQERFSQPENGFTVLAFPTNEFHQELGSNEEIHEYLDEHFPHLNFPIFGLSKALPENPVYQNLQAQLPTQEVRGNFFKYLVDRNGKAVSFYTKKEFPITSHTIVRDIETLLQEQPYNAVIDHK